MRGAVIGAGFFGTIQLAAWKRVSGAEIVAVCDLDEARARAAAEAFGLMAHTDPTAMLKAQELDFVDIATRPESHRQLVAVAAGRGLPVLCQKPLAPSIEEAWEIVRIAEAAGIRLMVNENFRWQPWYRKVKEILSEGALGEVFHASFRLRTGDGRAPEHYPNQPYFAQMERLLIYETLSHHIDVTRWVFGEPTMVFCQIQRLNPQIRGEDLAICQFRLASGATLMIDANRYSDPSGSEADRAMSSLRVEGTAGQVRVTRDGRLFRRRLGGPEEECPLIYDDRGYRGSSAEAAQQHFVDALRSGLPFETDGRDYLRTMAVVFACYRSAETGSVIVLEA